MYRVALTIRAFLVALLVAGTGPALAQANADGRDDRRKVQLSTAERAPLTEQDIVVTGIRLIEGKPPIPSRRLGLDAGASRAQFLRAEQFARCADRPRIDLLRRVVDGPPNDAGTRHALDTLIRANLGCYPDFPKISLSPPELGTCHSEMVGNLRGTGAEEGTQEEIFGEVVCRANYTRSAIVEQVLRTYAPDLRLTRAQTWSEDVRRRFDAREPARNGKRLKRDYLYFAVAACLVQAEPELANFLIRSAPAGLLSMRIQDTMFARAPHCVGFARSVRADPAQFRTYVADALYRWIVAAEGIDSLIPA